MLLTIFVSSIVALEGLFHHVRLTLTGATMVCMYSYRGFFVPQVVGRCRDESGDGSGEVVLGVFYVDFNGTPRVRNKRYVADLSVATCRQIVLTFVL